MKIHSVTILQITSAPARLEDQHGNIYAGYALVELEVTYDPTEPVKDKVRDVLPFGTDGGLIGLPVEDDSYYLAHGLADDRPQFAHFADDATDRSTLMNSPGC